MASRGSIQLAPDRKVAFPAYFVRGTRSKTDLREFVARHALQYLTTLSRRGVTGAIMVDIDDTLIDGNEAVANGFQFMRQLYDDASLRFPLHIVTARPDEDHQATLRMLRKRGFVIPPDRLHMLPTSDYGKGTERVERFKAKTYDTIRRSHHHVVARFGDKLWDVAHLDSLHDYLSHVDDRACYIFRDPRLHGTYSAKLPG